MERETMEERREVFGAEKIRAIDMETDCAEVFVETVGETEMVQIQTFLPPEMEYKCGISNGVLRIFVRGKRRICVRRNDDVTRIKLTLPQNMELKAFSMENGTGDSDLRRACLSGEEICFTTGAGTVCAENLYAKERLKVDCGAGNIILENVRATNAKVECGVGHFVMNGSVEKNLDVECGVGGCEIALAGNESDYSYAVSCGIGCVSVNGNRISGLAGTHKSGSVDAKGRISVECGVGRVALKIG